MATVLQIAEHEAHEKLGVFAGEQSPQQFDRRGNYWPASPLRVRCITVAAAAGLGRTGDCRLRPRTAHCRTACGPHTVYRRLICSLPTNVHILTKTDTRYGL